MNASPWRYRCRPAAARNRAQPRKIGESVKQINDHFPHWFNTMFKIQRQPDKLPLRSALSDCALRPASGAPAETPLKTPGPIPRDNLQMLQAADPVYRLLGAEGLDASQAPEVGKLLTARSDITSGPADIR